MFSQIHMIKTLLHHNQSNELFNYMLWKSNFWHVGTVQKYWMLNHFESDLTYIFVDQIAQLVKSQVSYRRRNGFEF